jgi:hypothetical protein
MQKYKGKTIGYLIKKAEKEFNKFIRLRDNGKPCIACGKFNTLQAGHFYPCGGYSGLRFLEDNVHGECARCNAWDEGHLIGYHDNLIDRIGLDAVNDLKQAAKEYKADGSFKWQRSELIEIIEKYQQRNKVSDR